MKKKVNQKHQWMKKLYKEDDDLGEHYLENQYDKEM